MVDILHLFPLSLGKSNSTFLEILFLIPRVLFGLPVIALPHHHCAVGITFNLQSEYFILLTTEIVSEKVMTQVVQVSLYLVLFTDTKTKPFPFPLSHEL